MHQKLFQYTEPDYVRDRNFKRVGEWTGDGYEAAKRMHRERPAEFYRIQGWADAEAEAEPIRYKYAEKKAKDKDKHKKSVNNSIKRTPPPQPPANVPYDPADDPGDALVSGPSHIF